MTTVHLIAAARPNFMKVAPLYHALNAAADFDVKLVHTGQHYDANMSDAFFRDLGLPDPHFHLGVGSGSHAEQTGQTMIEYERVALRERPDWVIVVGDVNATVAVAMVCAKLHLKVVHLEAGLRSGDRRMPEEINRILTDAIADVLWTPSADGDANLAREGVAQDKIELVGNIMMDSFELQRPRIDAAQTAERMGLAGERFGVVTLHRPSNVDAADTLALIVDELLAIADELPLIFPVHPRTAGRLDEFDLRARLDAATSVSLVEPMGYIDFMNLVTHAALAITDSGGLQEETTYLGVPCITLRPNTERPITVTEGTNVLSEPARLRADVADALARGCSGAKRPPLWDGQTAPRCVASLRRRAAMS